MFGWANKVKVRQIGVDFMPTGVAVVDVEAKGKNRGLVNISDFLPAVGVEEQTRVLQQWVEQQNLKHADCVSLIAKHDVQVFQLEKPVVEEQELLQAVSWKIRDLISYDVDRAVVDIFQMPSSPKNPASYINAVVANDAVVSTYVDRICESGLALQAIDVHDLVGNNFHPVTEFSEQTIALLQFSDHDGLMTIYHDRDLYVSRDLKIGLVDIEVAIDEEDEAFYENMLLELQRSMDYFESTYAMGSVVKMLLFPMTSGTQRMASYLQNYLAYDLDFAEVPVKDGRELNRYCFAAYCAALRGLH
jgi:MSHA biogenesis protein MshI